MKRFYVFLFCIATLMVGSAFSQNVGVGTVTPTEKLDVNGKVKTNSIILNSGGNQYDFLMKSNATGEVGFKHATGALGLNYIICISGSYPSSGLPVTSPFLGEIKLFAGNFAPQGWVPCNGQILSISQNTALFSILGTMYGGNGQSTFGLPDLRGAAAIGKGEAPVGYEWSMGQKTY